MLHRFGRERPRVARATAGDVFVALSRDPWAREMLGEVYRKLFEGEGVRRGSSPDHFIYVEPRKARSEINALADWVGQRYGSPGSTVPKKTPFGYLSGPWDGWLTYFATLSYGSDRGLAGDFSESVAGMSWAAYGVSRTAAGRGSAPEVRLLPAWSGGESASGGGAASAPPSPAPPPVPPPSPVAPEVPKSGLFERILGVKAKVQRPAPPPSVDEEEDDRRAMEEWARRKRVAEDPRYEDLRRALERATYFAERGEEAEAEKYKAEAHAVRRSIAASREVPEISEKVRTAFHEAVTGGRQILKSSAATERALDKEIQREAKRRLREEIALRDIEPANDEVIVGEKVKTFADMTEEEREEMRRKYAKKG